MEGTGSGNLFVKVYASCNGFTYWFGIFFNKSRAAGNRMVSGEGLLSLTGLILLLHFKACL